MREIQEERDSMEIEINNHKSLQLSQENNQEGLQRVCSELEQDKAYL